MTIGLAATVLAFGFALWLGLYLVGRDPRDARCAHAWGFWYALALACDLLSSPP